ncbi:MAG: 2-C-methyl-D-erythritol 2,4-cyclodiphosphate synthase [Actinomycetota bacterium]|nr:2-C-methyl-D-erythritol 2,4-cyclodiphosphate synthase [Actinomycetota bacterium]
MIRSGIGFDAHAFADGRPLVLGGVEIAHSQGLAGHSDADVLSHAIADALIGAARLGDIGSLFPADDRWRDAPSTVILTETSQALADAGWKILNVDATIVAEEPRLDPYREQMVERMASALRVPTSEVWVKATTTDGMGFTGRGEGIAAFAVALIEKEAGIG